MTSPTPASTDKTNGQTNVFPYTPQLRSLLQKVSIPSFRALSREAEVSEWQVEQLRRGRATQLRAEALIKLSQALQISLEELVTTFTDGSLPSKSSPDSQALQQEYQRLKAQLEQQQQQLLQEFRQSTLQTLESLLLQLPTAAHAAQQNPQIPATRLLPLLRPLDQLLQDWGIEAIAPVGTELPYDPQQHQLMDGTAQPGELVKVRYTGYVWGDRLLHRAKVSPVVQN